MATPPAPPPYVPALSFGIGCLTFEPQPGPAWPKSWGQHFRNVDAALRDAGATDIEISYDDDFEHGEPYAENRETRMFDGGPYGFPSWVSVDFEIRVPATFQRAQSPWREPGAETYRVFARYPYHLPVTFVVSEHSSDPDPSRGVQLIREFLNDRLQDSEDVRFDWLGPSPFHADAYLAPREPIDPKDARFGYSRLRQRGYDVLRFDFDPLAYSADEAFERLINNADEQLSFVYLVRWVESRRHREWERIDKAMSSLIEAHQEQGVRPYLRRTFRTGSVTSDTFIALASFESELLVYNRSLEETFSQVFGKQDDFFDEQARHELDHMFAYPVAQTSDLVARFESRRTGATANVLLILGPLVGVAVGAILALLIGDSGTPPPS